MNKQLEEAIKHLKNGKKISIIELLRILKKEGTEKFYFSRKEYADTILKELERLQEETIEKDKIREIIKNEKINISGLEVITVGDLEELLKENNIRKLKK